MGYIENGEIGLVGRLVPAPDLRHRHRNRGVAPVAHFLGDLLNARAGLLAQARVVAQGKRDRRFADPGGVGDILEVGRHHFIPGRRKKIGSRLPGELNGFMVSLPGSQSPVLR